MFEINFSDPRKYQCFLVGSNPDGCVDPISKNLTTQQCCCSDGMQGSRYGEECKGCPVRATGNINEPRYNVLNSFKEVKLKINSLIMFMIVKKKRYLLQVIGQIHTYILCELFLKMFMCSLW